MLEGAHATDDGVHNDYGGEGPALVPVRLNMACISMCIDTGLRASRVRTSALSSGVGSCSHSSFDEHGSKREVHRALGVCVGALRGRTASSSFLMGSGFVLWRVTVLPFHWITSRMEIEHESTATADLWKTDIPGPATSLASVLSPTWELVG